MPGAQGRLNTSQSEGNLSTNSRLSDSRRAKLINLKKREDLKDALTEKFKSRFGKSATGREDDECSVASSAIRREVDHFANKAHVTEHNLGRLERRLQKHASAGRRDSDVMSQVSAYSSSTQRSRSMTQLAGNAIAGTNSAPQSFDWCKLDEYASYLHEQDALRQKLGVHALQSKLRMDLDQQVEQKQMRRQEAMEEDARYHQNSLIELERWKANEQAREQERQAQNIKETLDRDEQLAYERKLKGEELQRKKDEESSLVDKIVTEMESEQRRFERKKEQTKKAMKKVFEENMDDQRKRQQAKKEQMNKEAAAMKEYNRVLDEQEEQRAAELGDRMERQNDLMKKLQENVAAVQKGAGDNDAQRAGAQQEEMDRHFFEAESLKQARLSQLRLENQAYLLKQMEEKDGRGEEDKELQNIQAMILGRDTQEYNEIEKQKIVDRRIRNLDHRKDIEKQMEYKMRQSQPEMSEAEIQMNKPLLNLVNRTLDERDQQMMDSISEGYNED